MDSSQFGHVMQASLPITEELIFLKEQTGEEETTLLIQALHIGLHSLYRQTVEKMFIDGEIPRERAIDILGKDRVCDIEYAQDALKTDILQGLRL